MELVDFLKARLGEEQAEAEKLPDVDDYHLEPWAIQREETGEWNSYGYLRIAKARVLAEVEAKRELLRGAQEWEGGTLEYYILAPLARVYQQHPDFQAEWLEP